MASSRGNSSTWKDRYLKNTLLPIAIIANFGHERIRKLPPSFPQSQTSLSIRVQIWKFSLFRLRSSRLEKSWMMNSRSCWKQLIPICISRSWENGEKSKELNAFPYPALIWILSMNDDNGEREDCESVEYMIWVFVGMQRVDVWLIGQFMRRACWKSNASIHKKGKNRGNSFHLLQWRRKEYFHNAFGRHAQSWG